MLRQITLSILLSITLNCSAQAIETGNVVPPLEIATFDGKRFNTADARGEVIILNVWASWCTYCREEMPALETYYRRHKTQGLQVIAVTIDEESAEAKAREILKPYTFTGGIGRLSKLAPLGNISRLPLTFVVDRNGILRRHGLEGSPQIDLAKLENEVTPLLKQKSSNKQAQIKRDISTH